MTALATDAPPRPLGRPRRLPLPRLEPEPEPYGSREWDEPVAPGCVVLTLPLIFGRPVTRALPAEPATAGGRPAPDGLPAPGPWAARLLHAVAEIERGARPIRHLAKCTTEDVLEEIEAAMHRHGGPHRRPGLATDRPTVGTVRVCRPAAGVAEVSATLRAGGRTTAVALRLEADEGQWRCTALQR